MKEKEIEEIWAKNHRTRTACFGIQGAYTHIHFFQKKTHKHNRMGKPFTFCWNILTSIDHKTVLTMVWNHAENRNIGKPLNVHGFYITIGNVLISVSLSLFLILSFATANKQTNKHWTVSRSLGAITLQYNTYTHKIESTHQRNALMKPSAL